MLELPQDLAQQVEDGSWLGSCDWGYCDREQAGWAESNKEPGYIMAICGPCSRGEFPKGNLVPLSVDRFWRLPEDGEEFTTTPPGQELS